MLSLGNEHDVIYLLECDKYKISGVIKSTHKYHYAPFDRFNLLKLSPSLLGSTFQMGDATAVILLPVSVSDRSPTRFLLQQWRILNNSRRNFEPTIL